MIVQLASSTAVDVLSKKKKGKMKILLSDDIAMFIAYEIFDLIVVAYSNESARSSLFILSVNIE